MTLEEHDGRTTLRGDAVYQSITERYAWAQDRFCVSWQPMFAGDRAPGA